MANFSVTTAVLFCFFTLSLALTTLNTPEDDDVATAVSTPLPDASPATTSDQSVPVNADDNPLSLSTALPLTKISLRPFYRLFSKFPCHHRHKFYKDDPMRPLEIPYGNDMLVSSGENSEFQDPKALHGGSWQQVKLHHHQHHQHHHHHHHHDESSDSESDSDSDDEDEDDRIKKMVLKRRHFGGFDAEKKLKILKKLFRHENAEEEEHHHKKERDGFMIRVRKFFDHYF
ncbi:uncharacterized protein [Primulina huaijiensis]|uniref:uncharacterized protein n=1 Tax=Primulina huaijiensis TaxID=1492673 RepID=UPI003CC76506